MLRKKLKYNVKKEVSNKFHDESKFICVCNNPIDTGKLHNGHNTVVSFFSKCVMGKKRQKKLWKSTFPNFFFFLSLVVLILLKHQPYFGWQLLPDEWRWDDQTEPWWTLQPGSPSSASRCSPLSGSSGPLGCLASPVASCVRSKPPRIHLNAKTMKILNQIHVFSPNKMSWSELEWCVI